MLQINGIAMFQALKNIDNEVIICLITANISYLEQLKQKIPNIKKICNTQTNPFEKSKR